MIGMRYRGDVNNRVSDAHACSRLSYMALFSASAHEHTSPKHNCVRAKNSPVDLNTVHRIPQLQYHGRLSLDRFEI